MLRALAKKEQTLRAARTEDARKVYRELFVLDLKSGAILQKKVTLEKLAKELDLLDSWERLA